MKCETCGNPMGFDNVCYDCVGAKTDPVEPIIELPAIGELTVKLNPKTHTVESYDCPNVLVKKKKLLELVRKCEKLEKENNDIRDQMQDYIFLANVVCGYIGMKHTHPMYKSITADLMGIINKLKGEIK